MPDPTFGTISHLLRWMDLGLALMSIIKEIGILRFRQFLQLLLMVFGSLFYTFIKLIFSRTRDPLFFYLVDLGPARRKNAFPMN